MNEEPSTPSDSCGFHNMKLGSRNSIRTARFIIFKLPFVFIQLLPLHYTTPGSSPEPLLPFHHSQTQRSHQKYSLPTSDNQTLIHSQPIHASKSPSGNHFHHDIKKKCLCTNNTRVEKYKKNGPMLCKERTLQCCMFSKEKKA